MTENNQTNKNSLGGWILLAIAVHIVIGGTMVPLRYVQTVVGLPSLGTVAVGDLIAFVLMAGFMIPKVKKEFWRSRALWLMVVIVILRTIFWTLSGRFTEPYLAQMVNLLAPFFVILFDRLVNKAQLPKFTIPAIFLSLVGGVLLIFGDWRAV